jgi:hypothetical protein
VRGVTPGFESRSGVFDGVLPPPRIELRGAVRCGALSISSVAIFTRLLRLSFREAGFRAEAVFPFAEAGFVLRRTPEGSIRAVREATEAFSRPSPRNERDDPLSRMPERRASLSAPRRLVSFDAARTVALFRSTLARAARVYSEMALLWRVSMLARRTRAAVLLPAVPVRMARPSPDWRTARLKDAYRVDASSRCTRSTARTPPLLYIETPRIVREGV